MGKPAIKFLLSVIVITAICIVAELLWRMYLPPILGMHNGFVMLGIMVTTVVALHLFLLRSVEGRPQNFVRAFMVTMVLKFMLFMLLLIGFLMFTAESPKGVVLHFLLYYSLFTILEVAMLYKGVQK